MKVFTWKQRILVLGISLGVITLFVAVGYGIGLLLGNGKLGIILAVLLSYPVTQWTLVKSVQKLYEKESIEDKDKHV